MAKPQVLRLVRRFCLECQGNASQEIRRCQDTQCALWPWRLGHSYDTGETSAMAQHKALRCVRRHCLQCAGHRKDVRSCAEREKCPLWSLRFGVFPHTYNTVRRRFFAPRKLSLFAVK